MKRFRFSLQAVRTLRERQEQEALEKYAGALAAEAESAGRLAQVEAELQQTRQQWEARLRQGCSAREILQLQGFLTVLADQRLSRQKELENAQKLTRDRHQQVLVARQKREILDKCRAHQRRAFDQECARHDQRDIDEMASRMLARS